MPLISTIDQNAPPKPSTVYIEFQLLQLRILPFGFFQDGNIKVSVFPERQENLCPFRTGRLVLRCDRSPVMLTWLRQFC
jgi:hypothetical protein